MPDTCYVPGCKNRRKKGTGITFHSFPFRDPDRVKRWVVSIGREPGYKPSKNACVCSDHFRKTDFDRSGNTVRLFPHAVPEVSWLRKSNKRREQQIPKWIIQRDFKDLLGTDESPEAGLSSTGQSPEAEQGQAITMKSKAKRKRPKPPKVTMNYDHTYAVSQSAKQIKQKLDIAIETLKDNKLKIKVNQQKIRRLQTRNNSLEKTIISLKEEHSAKEKLLQTQMTVLERSLDWYQNDSTVRHGAQHTQIDPHVLTILESSLELFNDPEVCGKQEKQFETCVKMLESSLKLLRRDNDVQDAVDRLFELRVQMLQSSFDLFRHELDSWKEPSDKTLEKHANMLESSLEMFTHERNAWDAICDDALKSNLDGVVREMFELMSMKGSTTELVHAHSDELKEFAMTLYSHGYYAYEHVRRLFFLALPYTRTIHKWIKAKGEQAAVQKNSNLLNNAT